MVKMLINAGIQIKGSRILILGITFKENCPDIRNSKIVDVYRELIQFGLEVHVFDPEANRKEVFDEYKFKLVDHVENDKFDGILLAVAHDKFKDLNLSDLKKRK